MACRESEMQRGHHLTEQITHRMGSTRRNTGANISFAIAVGFGLQYLCVQSTCRRMELLSKASAWERALSRRRFCDDTRYVHIDAANQFHFVDGRADNDLA
jgi:hypothetical protein